MKINICYLILNILFLLTARFYLQNKNLSTKQKIIAVISYLLFTIISYPYISEIINSIFQLKYLNVKSYLLLLITTNIIMLITINRSIKLAYKIPNYLLYIIITIILGSILSVVLGNKFNTFYIMDIKNAINFMDLSFVIFILYLIIISLIYIGYKIFDKDINKKVEINLPKIKIPNLKLPKISILNKTKNKKSEKNILTPEEIFNYQYNDNFYINGEECSIIFEDSNKENIIKNYYILNEDIHARLMNGYTLEENKMLRNICMKLQISNVRTVNLNNTNILNRISVEEYNLLKKVLS